MKAVVLVSGWAMSADVMTPLAEALVVRGCTVRVMSLADADGESWEALLSALDKQVGEDKCVLVGWSLGGNLCARFAARHPDKVAGLVTMGSTPCFVACDSWPNGKHPDAYQEFADGVAADLSRTLKGFAPICSRGSEHLKDTIRLLATSTKWVLAQSTDWCKLLDRLVEDARGEWQQVSCPTVHLLAEQDPLAKPATANDLKALLPEHEVRILTGSHVLFLDHKNIVVDIVTGMGAGA